MKNIFVVLARIEAFYCIDFTFITRRCPYKWQGWGGGGSRWPLSSLPAQTVLWFYHIKHQFCRSPFIPLEKGIARQEKLDKYENDPSFSRSCSLTSVQKKSRKYLLVFQPHCFSHIGSLGLSCLLLWENIKQTSAKTEAWTTS